MRGKGDLSASSVDLDALAARLVPLVLARLAAVLTGATEPSTYTTRPVGPRPPEFADRHRAWRETCPNIPGAKKIGRWYSISHTDFARWRDGKGTKGTTGPARPASAECADWTPARLAEDLGFRLVSGGSR